MPSRPKERTTRVYGPEPHRRQWRLRIRHPGGDWTSESFPSKSKAEEAKKEILSGLKTENAWLRVAELEEQLEEARAHALAAGQTKTVKDVLDAYLEDRRHEVKQNTIITYRDLFLGIMQPALDKPAHALTPRQATDLYDASTRKFATARHHSCLGLVKRVWAWAVARKLARPGVWDDVKPRGKQKTGKVQLRLSEARRFYAEALERASTPVPDSLKDGLPRRNWLSRRLGALCALCAMLLALRVSEILGVRGRDLEADVDNEGCGLWYVEDSKTPNGVRVIQVPPVLWELLRERIAEVGPEGRLFPHTRRWGLLHVYRICNELGIRQVGIHSLRGLHASVATQSGATPHEVARTLGHGGIAVTERNYISPEAKETRKANKRHAFLQVLEGGRESDERVKENSAALTHDSGYSEDEPETPVKSSSSRKRG